AQLQGEAHVRAGCTGGEVVGAIGGTGQRDALRRGRSERAEVLQHKVELAGRARVQLDFQRVRLACGDGQALALDGRAPRVGHAAGDGRTELTVGHGRVPGRAIPREAARAGVE